jgi:putative transposase
MTLFRNKYRIESSRLQNHDYSSNGVYFITICSHQRFKIFGEIISGIMYQSEIGRIVEKEWLKSFEMRKELICEEWFLMPDHLHALVRINNKKAKETFDSIPVDISEMENVLPFDPSELKKNTGVAYRPPKSLSSFVAGFKASATTKINQFRKTPFEKVWLPRFDDHIVHDAFEMGRIRQYIKDNPKNWGKPKKKKT